MNSSIILGQVFHKRFFPAVHRFRYPLRFFCLDLSELKSLDLSCPGFAYNRMGISSIHDRDYLDSGPGSIKEKLERILKKNRCDILYDRIMLVTSARFILPVFNPVSFYVLLTDTQDIKGVVVEVNNTFGERHVYILVPETDQNASRYTTLKAFHVSPFNTVAGDYDFQFSLMDTGIDIRITYRVDGRKKFIARLWGSPLPFTGRHLLRTGIKHPLLPHLTMGRIFKEAFVLYFKKKLPYVPKPVDTHAMTIGKKPSNLIQKICLAFFNREMKRISSGRITVTFPDGRIRHFGHPESLLQADLTIIDYNFFPKVVFEGDIGFGEAFMDGLFQTSDLRSLLEIFILSFNGRRISGRSTAFFAGFVVRLIRGNSANTLKQSPENIHRHYDLSNDFFSTFLDAGMNYSSALFLSGDDSLETAQTRKLDHIIAKARISARDRVLEIGSGWGDFAVRAVRQTGCTVTTVTLSAEQFAHVHRRITDEGLEEKIHVLFQDYRTLTGQFDKIISIEMLEAVGHRYLGTFFSTCNSLLRKNGRIVLQVITIPDQQYTAYRFRLDWIQKHIFPGGHLPSLTFMSQALTRSTPFIVDHLENIGPHYAKTLDHWYRRFVEHRDAIRAQGFDTVFLRKWEYYLKSSEAMFHVNALEDLQLVLVRPCERISENG